jgi:ferritin
VTERLGRVGLLAIEQPPSEWGSPLEAFEEACKHEVKVTGLINNLVNIAIAEKDYATQNMLQWFVTQQVEEEAQADGIVQKLKLAGTGGPGLLIMDQGLGQRKPE